jgi:subtilase family serine protease
MHPQKVRTCVRLRRRRVAGARVGYFLPAHAVSLVAALVCAGTATAAVGPGELRTTAKQAAEPTRDRGRMHGETPIPHRAESSRWEVILESCDERSLTLRLAPGPYNVDAIGDNLAAPGLHRGVLPEWSGNLPVATVAVAVPPAARLGITFAAGPLGSAGSLPSSGTRRAPYPASPARITYEGWIRGQRVCYVALCPFVCDPRTGDVSVYGSLRATVTFAPGGADELRHPAENPHPFDHLFDRVLLNARAAAEWRQGPPVASPSPLQWPDRLGAYKMLVNERGICRLTREYLLAQGVPVQSVDPRTFRVMNRGEEVPLLVEGEDDGSFDQGECIRFWVTPNFREDAGARRVPVEGEFTGTNVYWLDWGGEPGLRMTSRSVDPAVGGQVPSYYPWTAHAEEDHHPFVPDEQAISGDRYGSEWFWEELRSGTMLPDSGFYPFVLQAPALQAAQGCSCHVRIAMNGLTDVKSVLIEHQAILRLNGHHLATVVWGGETEEEQEFLYDTRRPEYLRYVPMDWLHQGQNWFEVVLPGLPDPDVYDAVYVDWFGLDFWRLYDAASDTLLFTCPAQPTPTRWMYRLRGFGSDSLELYDVTGGGAARLVGYHVESELGGFTLVFSDSLATGAQLYALAEGRYVLPTAVVEDTAYQFPGGAEYLIVAHEDLVGAADALLSTWQSLEPGLQGAVVPVQEIYDAFSWGIFHPGAIRDFLTYAYAGWQPAPVHVLLFGDATWDYKLLADDSDPSHRNFVPSWGNPAWDDYFAMVDGDDLLPDLVMGRLPVENADTAAAVVSKLSSYLTGTIAGPWRDKVLMVADYYDDEIPEEFRQQCEVAIDSFVTPEPAFFTPETVFKDDGTFYPPSQTFADRDSIVAILNRGCALANYVGHGATWCWGSLLWGQDIQDRLYNSVMLPVVLSWTCHTGRFANPVLDSFAEEWLWKSGGGGVAFVGTTGWGETGYDQFQMWRLLQELLRDENRRVGEALFVSKIAFADTNMEDALEERRNSPLYFTLVGDPRMRISLAPRPDLRVDSAGISLDPNEPVQGQVATITATIHNGGPDPVYGALVRFYRGEATPDSVLGEHTLGTIQSGDSATATCAWDTQGLVGWHRILVAADPDSTILEGREWNNTAERLFHVLPSMPDLTIGTGGISFDPPVPNPADSVVEIGATVRNTGTAPAGQFHAEFRDGTAAAPGELLGTVTVPQLAASDSTQAILAWPIDDTMVGGHVVWCILDPDDELEELDEANNVASAPVDILSRVELVVTSEDIVFSNPSPPEGDPLGIMVSVDNTGETSALGVGLDIYVDQHPDSAASQPFASVMIDSIPGQGSGEGGTYWPTIGQAGIHTVFAVADPDDEHEELNEDNNRASCSLEILALADLVPTSLVAEPPAPVETDTVAIRAVVRNAGMVPTPPFRVEFFHGAPELGDLISLWEGVELAETTSVTVGATWIAVPGDHEIWLRIDGLEAVEESNEDNNIGVCAVFVLTLPDLAVTVDAPSETLIAGDTLWVRGTVENLGEANASDVDVELFREVPPSQWSLVSSVSLGALAGQHSCAFDLPWDVVPGSHHLAIRASCSCAEADTTNNELDFWVVAREPRGADLHLSGTFIPSEAVEGDTVRFQGVVDNQGEVTAHTVRLTVWEGAEVARESLGVVAAGAELPVSVGWVPARGNHWYDAQVRCAGEEADTTDNNVQGQVAVLSRPDLSCPEMEIAPSSPLEGDTVLVRALIHNAGDLPATGFAVGVMVDERFETFHEIAELEGASETQVDYDWLTTGVAGTHTVTVWVDPDTRIQEGCETNNITATTVAVVEDTTGPSIETLVDGVAGFRAGDPIWIDTPLRIITRDAGTGVDTSSIRITLDGRRLTVGQDVSLTGEGREVHVVAVASPVPGRHTLAITGLADVAGNPSPDVPQTLLYTSCSAMQVTEFLAFPNPTPGRTDFLCLYPPVADADVSVEIYSLGGRLVRRLRYAPGATDVSWDTRDEDGDAVANGVYVARLVLRSGNGRATALTRVAVMR